MFKRMKHGVRLTALVVGLATTASLAFFIGSFMADGTYTGTAGSGGGSGVATLPVKVKFPSAELTPTKAVEVTAEVENTAGKQVTFSHITPTITTATEGCLASWFKITPTGEKVEFWEGVFSGTSSPVKYAAGTSPLVGSGTKLMLSIKNLAEDQSKCENAPVTVKFHLNE